jgi:hypothetical protein
MNNNKNKNIDNNKNNKNMNNNKNKNIDNNKNNKNMNNNKNKNIDNNNINNENKNMNENKNNNKNSKELVFEDDNLFDLDYSDEELGYPEINIETENIGISLILKKNYSEIEKLKNRKDQFKKDISDFFEEFFNTEEFNELMKYFE